jgi:hypothetical protein
MDGKIDISCEFSFLEKFCNETPAPLAENYMMWRKYFDLFCCDNIAVRFTDIGSSEFIDKLTVNSCNIWMEEISRVLLSNYYDKCSRVVCDSELGKQMKMYEQDGDGCEYFSPEKETIFFMDRTKDECKRMEEDYGLLFISMENLYEHEFLFSTGNEPITNKSNLWDCVKYYNHPCNYIILIDLHVMKKGNDLIEKYFFSLFDSLLPKILNKMDFKVDLYINEDDTEDALKKKKECIEDCVKSVRASYKPLIVFHKISNDKIHDRYLLTNYGYFKSGYGFVLTDTERKKGTDLDFFPITHLGKHNSKSNTSQSMHNIREKMKLF